MNKSQFSNMNSAVKTDDYKFNQIQSGLQFDKSIMTASKARNVRKDTMVDKLAGWAEPLKGHQPRQSINLDSVEKVPLVKVRPVPLDLKTHLQKISIKGRRTGPQIRGKESLSPIGTSSKRKPMKGLDLTKDFLPKTPRDIYLS